MKTCILKFDHLSNLLLRRLYCIDAWMLHCIGAYSWNRLAQKMDMYRNLLLLYLDCNVFWIYKHKDKGGQISNNPKFLSHNNLSFFWWKNF